MVEVQILKVAAHPKKNAINTFKSKKMIATPIATLVCRLNNINDETKQQMALMIQGTISASCETLNLSVTKPRNIAAGINAITRASAGDRFSLGSLSGLESFGGGVSLFILGSY
jgi:hypothetical protein